MKGNLSEGEVKMPTLTTGRMERKQLTTGSTASFRVPDAEFATAFNIGLEATGASVAELTVECVRAGLVPAVKAMLQQRQSGERRFVKWVAQKGK